MFPAIQDIVSIMQVSNCITFQALQKGKKNDPNQFRYKYKGKNRVASANTIVDYVIFAKDIGLLSESLEPSIDKKDIKVELNQQNWMAVC